MSGGHFNYIHYKIEEVAEEIGIVRSKEEIEFSNLLKEVAKLCKSIEWAYSGDLDIEDFKKDWNNFKKEHKVELEDGE